MTQGLNFAMVRVVQLFTGPDVYTVPDYQRRYAWEREVVEDFWVDIKDACDSGMRQYFLGTTISIPRDLRDASYYEVVDGQQRLATLSILMAAIRDWLHESKASDAAWLPAQIENHLVYTDPATLNTRSRVKLGATDDSYFSTYIIDSTKDVATKRANADTDSQKRMLDAYLYFFDRIDEMMNSGNGNWLAKYYKYLTENVVMMSIKTGEDSDAFHVFESVNARGTALSHMDLLKSYLLSRVLSIDRQDTSRRWTSMMSRFSESQSLRFFRYYWMSEYELLRKMNLYRKVKLRVQSGLNPKTLVETLDAESENYQMIIKAQGINSRRTRHYLGALRSLGATQVHPILLSTAARFRIDSPQFESTAAALTSFVMRKFIIGDERPGVFETDAGKLARSIREKSMNTAGLISKLCDMAPDDEQYEQDFAECEIRSVRAAKYILKEIESSRSRTSETGVLDVVDLEHILPKHPDDSWLKVLGDDDKDHWIHRLGNLTVIDKGLNRGIKNKSFTKKKKKYKMSEIRITSDLVRYVDWTPAEIERRQAKFAKKAVEIWKVA